MKSKRVKAAIERYRNAFVGTARPEEIAEYCRLFTEVAEIAEQEAEERIRAELLRWHDPKEELPEEGAVVLGEIANEWIAYYAILHYDIFGWWIRPTPLDGWASCPYDVMKWRYIHE